jgi:hypothetical protein
MKVPDKYHSILEKIVGIHQIAVSPPFFVPPKIKSSVDRAITLNHTKAITNDIQHVCTI